MNSTIAFLTSSLGISMSSRNFYATDRSASSGQGWNQSITVQLMMAGNFLALPLKPSPTGEKQSDICKFLRTRSRKNLTQLSLLSGMPSPLTAALTLFTIPSQSSSLKRSEISPDESKSLRETRNRSFVI